MKLRLITLVSLFLILVGCAAPSVTPVDSSLNETNSGVINLIRKKQFTNAGVTYRIFFNGEYMGELKNGGKLTRRAKLGKVLVEYKPFEFGIPSIGAKKVNLDLEKGFDYYLQLDHQLGSIVPIGNTVSVNRSTNIHVSRKAL